MHCILLIHSFVHGHLGCFYLLATLNNAVINTGVQMSQHLAFNSFRDLARSGITA